MSAGWLAAGVRARLLLRRRLGRERAVALAETRSLREAVASLAGGVYARDLEAGASLEEAQRAVAASVLLHLRLLAGWLPPGALGVLRALAGWFEIANVEARLAYLGGAELRPSFDLGPLATAWAPASRVQSGPELRSVLAASAWGDPGSESEESMRLGLRLSWAARVHGMAPELADLVAGGLALLVARELHAAGRPPELLARHGLPVVGPGWEEAGTLAALRESLPAEASWALAGVAEDDELWRAEVGWWRRLERQGSRLAARRLDDEAVVVGVAALLAVDAWRTSAALSLAHRGGEPELWEVLGGTA